MDICTPPDGMTAGFHLGIVNWLVGLMPVLLTGPKHSLYKLYKLVCIFEDAIENLVFYLEQKDRTKINNFIVPKSVLWYAV